MPHYDSPYLQAAYELAEEAHKGQKRRDKSDYINHPVMVAKILEEMGCSKMQQAVALLHDVLEDWKALNSSSLDLHMKLMGKLEEKILPSTVDEYKKLAEWSHKICNGVKALTNDTYRYEGKRTYQAGKASELSIFLGPVKTIDQAASVIDDIIGCDFTHEESVNKARGFALKGFDVTRSACDTGTPFRRFYAKLYTQFRELMVLSREHSILQEDIKTTSDEQEKQEIKNEVKEVVKKMHAIRENFDYKMLIEQAKEEAHIPLIPGLMPANVENYYNSLSVDDPVGIERITVSDKGRVVSYGMVVSLDETDRNPANNLSIKFRDALERVPKVFINTGGAKGKPIKLTKFGLEEHHTKEDNRTVYVRDFAIEPPVDLNFFIQHALETGAMHSESPLFKAVESVSQSLPSPQSRAL